MTFSEGTRSTALLAACGGDTVKLFDVNVDSGDPCLLSYTPTPGALVNSVKWNHTNLVVASAGDDKKITLWQKNGQRMGTLPLSRSDTGESFDESISAISFSNKGSRYLCSGGSGRIVKIWDLQRKLCIKKLSGHTDTITGVMYNFKDEHLASISLKGDLILHNLASGARAADLKDPIGQVLRVLDYSRSSRHILVTAGDDGSVHLWDTTGRTPKVSWLKQHSAPTTGVCFSPLSDKVIASVGLDKKLYMFDSTNKKQTYCAPYEAPFSSLAFRDDGNILAAGTNSGRVVFYDVRGKPQPFTVLRAYNSIESVMSLCWQKSKPVTVNENNCTAEIALLGGAGEESILMPDPLPSVAVSTSSSTGITSSRTSSLASTTGSISIATATDTPVQSNLLGRGSLSKLQAPHNYNLKDDMDVFSPLVDVQPITPSLDSWWDGQDEAKKDGPQKHKKTFFPSSIWKFPHSDTNNESHPISDWRISTSSMQDDDKSVLSPRNVTPLASSRGESCFSPAPPDAWGGNAFPDKVNIRRQTTPLLSRMLPTGSVSSGSVSAGLQDVSAPTNFSLSSYLTNSSPSLTTSLGSKFPAEQSNLEPVSVPPALPRRYSTYAERLSTTSSFIDRTASTVSSPKSKKTGTETREEISSLLSKQDLTGSSGMGTLSSGTVPEPQVDAPRSSLQHGATSFSLQLVQRTLEEALGSMQQSIHEDVRNLHIEVLRQFHMQELEMSSLLSPVLEKLDELTKEVQSLRRENQQLRQLL